MKKIFTVFSFLVAYLIFATPNYVYHERTNNSTGCGSNQYVDFLFPTSNQDVTIKWKVEYASWYNQTRIFYTTDGSTPSVTFDNNLFYTTQGSTQSINAIGNFLCNFSGSGGTVDVFQAVLPKQSNGTVVKYIIASWYGSTNDVVKWANGGSGNDSSTSGATIFQYKVGETSWTGSTPAWDNGTPDATKNAIISADYSGAAFESKNLTIEATKTLTVNNTVTINGVLTNNGAIVVNDGGNLVQNTGSTYAGSGSFTWNKNTSSAANKYVFWASPVAGQNLFTIYNSGTPQFVTSYDSTTDTYTALSNPTTASPGMGYSVKVPTSAAPVTFVGAPNNADIPVTLNRTANGSGNTWNLVGNPYPSNINLASFYNSGNNGIDSSIYFWDNLTATNTSQLQNATTWGIFNAMSSTWNTSGLTVSGLGVKAGQGFIVKALASGTTTFTNSMRNANTANFINKNVGTAGEGKYWLKLTNPAGQQFQTAITYGLGATNAIEAFDSQVMSLGADAIYTFLNNTKLGIQGRVSFVNTDVVTLGNKHAITGNYTISLAGSEGIFANGGQAIYLKDKQNNTYTNLQTGDYTFSTLDGELQTRFDVVYQPQSALATAEVKAEEVVVYEKGGVFEVKSPKTIDQIMIFDASGRLINTLSPKANLAKINLKTKGIFVLKIQIGNESISKKIIK